VGRALPGAAAVGPLEQVVCMRDMFILNEIWAQKINIFVGTFLVKI
jgi:hypothetical protein